MTLDDPNVPLTGPINWEAGKRAHLQLSEEAAAQYDEIYEQSNFATGSYMHYEIEIIEQFAPSAPDHLVALDLGCGTGRDSFVLGRRFEQVYAFDFSPAMIDIAETSKLRRRAGNVMFRVRDLELGLWEIDDGTASFVNSSFGMASFVQNIEGFLREVRRLLKPRGMATFSFYNVEALVNRLELDWRPALAARLLPERQGLEVDFGGRIRRIAAVPYTLAFVKRVLEANFEIVQLTTFPTLSALFPQELFDHVSARDLCSRVDYMLAQNLELAAGPYIVAVVRKQGAANKHRPKRGYERVLELLAVHRVSKTLKEHAPVRNMTEVIGVLDAPLEEMVKSILVSSGEPDARDPRAQPLFLFAVPADRKLDLSKVARLLGCARNSLRMASQIEVEEVTGFTVGSVPPFGMPRNVPVVLDERLAALERVWCGTGKATESLQISLADLRMLSSASIGDVSKPA